jgi:hypothetical protein
MIRLLMIYSMGIVEAVEGKSHGVVPGNSRRDFPADPIDERTVLRYITYIPYGYVQRFSSIRFGRHAFSRQNLVEVHALCMVLPYKELRLMQVL